MKARVPLMLRLPAEVHREIVEAAKQNDRSLNAEVIARLTAKPDARSIAEIAADAARAEVRQQLNLRDLGATRVQQLMREAHEVGRQRALGEYNY